MRNVIIGALGPMLWGTTYLVTTEFLPPDRPLLISALRALPVGLLMLAASRRLPAGVWWWRSLLLGLLNFGLFFLLLFMAAYRLPGGVIATLGATQPLIVAVLGRLLLADPLSPRVLAGAVAGCAGAALLVLEPQARLDAAGLGAAAAAAVCMATGTVAAKRWGQPAPLPVYTAWQLTAGGLLLALLALVFERPWPALSARNLGGFVYLGLINTGLGYALWFHGIKHLKASAAAALGLLSPVVATALGFVVLHQVLSGQQVFGGLMIFAAIIAVQRPAAARLQTEASS